jgi:hypothetical protein
MGLKLIPKDKGSSNKNQTLPKYDHEHVEAGTLEGPSALNAPTPFIDKIAVVLTITSTKLAQQIHSALYQAMTNDTEYFQSVAKHVKGFQLGKLITMPGCEERVRIDYNFQNSLANRIRLEFNPAKLGFWGMKELHGVLTSVMPEGWDHFVTDGRISRLDVAVDLIGVRMTKLKMQPKIGQSAQAWWSSDGKLKTYQWGKPTGTHTQIYNKTAEQLARGIAVTGPQVTRIERRLKNPKYKKLTDLAGMNNPFAGIVLTTSIPEAPPGGPSYVWPMFCDSVQVRTLDLALKLLPKHKRTVYRNQFTKAAPLWWNPEAIWKMWPAMLDEIKIGSTTAWK